MPEYKPLMLSKIFTFQTPPLSLTLDRRLHFESG
jgi:hypothetical protein